MSSQDVLTDELSDFTILRYIVGRFERDVLKPLIKKEYIEPSDLKDFFFITGSYPFDFIDGKIGLVLNQEKVYFTKKEFFLHMKERLEKISKSIEDALRNDNGFMVHLNGDK